MPYVHFAFGGVEDLRAALKQLPDELADEARGEIIRTTRAAANELRAIYPAVTGNLRRGVKTKIREQRGETTGVVESTAPHAHLWEYGTVNRKTEKGWNRGRMPAQYTRGLVAIALRHQRTLVRLLQAIVERAGFKLTGKAA